MMYVSQLTKFVQVGNYLYSGWVDGKKWFLYHKSIVGYLRGMFTLDMSYVYLGQRLIDMSRVALYRKYCRPSLLHS